MLKRSILEPVATAMTVGLLALPAGADAAATRYTGVFTSAPGSEISFKLVEKRGKRMVRGLRYEGLTAFCDGGQTFPVISSTSKKALRVDRRGRFTRETYVDDPDLKGVEAFRGQIRGPKARGLLAVSFRTEGIKCSTGAESWEVARTR